MSMQVASLNRELALVYWNKLMPSGLLPSPRSRPVGSNCAGMPVD